MNRSIIKYGICIVCFLWALPILSQEKLTKVSQSIKVDKGVTIDLNTSHCNIEFDTWNKNTIEIEAYVEGKDLSVEELKDALKNWQVDIDATSNLVSIKTKGTPHVAWVSSGDYDGEAVNALLNEMKFELAVIPDLNIATTVSKMPPVPKVPPLPEMPAMPELPPLPEGVHNIHFDYNAYKKDGEKYLEKYSKEFDEKFGKDFAKKMEAWGKKFGKEWEEEYAKKMEAWGEEFGKEWGEKYGEQMEAWGERFAEQMEQQAERAELQKEREQHRKQLHKEREKMHEERAKMHEEREKLAAERRVKVERLIKDASNPNVKKTIKIKMPKDAKLKVNVRHGELKFAANIDNLKADLSHTTLIAQGINGSTTSINASYSPVYVTDWNIGELNLSYSDKVQLDNVRQLVLNSNSSNIKIENLLGNAIIDGSIGDFKILKIGDTFSNLNLVLQNANAVIALPKVDYALQYKGSQSVFQHPEKNKDNRVTSFSTGSMASNKNIILKAKFSNILMQ